MYHEYYTLFGPKQLIKCLTSATCNISFNLDHFLTSIPDRLSQIAVADAEISDHQWLLP